MQYEIVTSHNSVHLVEKVQEKLNEGWKPLGSPFMIPAPYNISNTIAQAIVKETVNDDEARKEA